MLVVKLKKPGTSTGKYFTYLGSLSTILGANQCINANKWFDGCSTAWALNSSGFENKELPLLCNSYLGVGSLRLCNVRAPPCLTPRSRKLCNFSSKRVDWQTLMQLRQSQRESATGTHCLRLPDISENVYLPNAILASFHKFMTWNYFSGKTE